MNLVKALIRGLKGSNSEKEKNRSEGTDIPDELPPLAEDVAKEDNKEQDPKEESDNKDSKEESDNKDSKEESDNKDSKEESDNKDSKEESDNKDSMKPLEPIEEPPPISQKKETEDSSNKLNEKDIPDDIPGFDESSDIFSKKDSNLHKSDKIDFSSNQEGFFSDILSITEKQGVNKNLLEKNLYKGMRNYHSSELNINIKPITKKEIDEQIINKLNELKVLEQKWQKQKEVIEKEKQLLHEYETNVKNMVEELKMIVKKQNLYEDVPVGKYFRTHDGIIAKNVFELLDILKIMDENVFRKHVGKKGNDISAWIKNAVGHKELATSLINISSKKQMISILENAFK